MVKLRLYGSKPTIVFGGRQESLAIHGEGGDLNVTSKGDILLKVERDDEQQYSSSAPAPPPPRRRRPPPLAAPSLRAPARAARTRPAVPAARARPRPRPPRRRAGGNGVADSDHLYWYSVDVSPDSVHVPSELLDSSSWTYDTGCRIIVFDAHALLASSDPDIASKQTDIVGFWANDLASIFADHAFPTAHATGDGVDARHHGGPWWYIDLPRKTSESKFWLQASWVGESQTAGWVQSSAWSDDQLVLYAGRMDYRRYRRLAEDGAHAGPDGYVLVGAAPPSESLTTYVTSQVPPVLPLFKRGEEYDGQDELLTTHYAEGYRVLIHDPHAIGGQVGIFSSDLLTHVFAGHETDLTDPPGNADGDHYNAMATHARSGWWYVDLPRKPQGTFVVGTSFGGLERSVTEVWPDSGGFYLSFGGAPSFGRFLFVGRAPAGLRGLTNLFEPDPTNLLPVRVVDGVYTVDGVPVSEGINLQPGTYLLDVPEEHPLRLYHTPHDPFLHRIFEMTGSEVTKSAPLDGATLLPATYYYGTVELQVKLGPTHEPFSFVCGNHGYMGSKDKVHVLKG